MSFNGPPNYPGGPQGAPSPHQQMGPQMRPHFMGGPPGQQHQSFPQNPPGGPNNANFMNNSAAAARYQNTYQRMSSHAQQQAAVAAMATGASGAQGVPCGNQIPSPGAMQRPSMMPNPMQNVSDNENYN